MCGIAGIVRWDDTPVREAEIRSMCRVMSHRGPDDEGVFVDGGVGLGMRRLSIIDVSHGQQPVTNEDGTVWAVFNGEIYNHADLRRRLQRSGHYFRTTCDSETIVHAYEEYGPECVHRMRGMFAFAIWDGLGQQIVLARDRLGIKPLYYAESDDQLVFASELKPILQVNGIERSLNWTAVRHLFTYMVTPADESIVQGVHKLEPARIAVGTRTSRRLRTRRYWDVSFEPNERASEPELVEQLRDIVTESVQIHRLSDVPVGAFLSGGIDSSAVVATMARQGGERVKTFSIGFHDSHFNELDHARQVASACDTDHHELILEPDVMQIVEDLTWYLDEPFGDTSAIPTYMVSKLASEHVKVVLTGDGGDEIFAGYDKYVVESRERAYDRIPSSLRAIAGTIGRAIPEGGRGRRFLQHLALDGSRRYLDASSAFTGDQLRDLFLPQAFEQLGAGDARTAADSRIDQDADWLSALQYRDLQTYLPLDILTKVDRMTMAHSVEARPPLLDHRVVEFAATIPSKLRLRGQTTKYLFKQAMRGLLPDAIIDRPKQGFAVPLAKWFRGQLSGFTRDLLLSDTCNARGIFNRSYLEKLIALNERGRNLDLQLWTLISFELWCRRFLDRSEPVCHANVA
jgi:asparagine synthase (glutamine-hydrolysing)